MRNLLLIFVAVSLLSGCASGGWRIEQPASYVALADMRYGDIISMLEPKDQDSRSLDLTDRWFLCTAYRYTRNFGKIFTCLDRAEALIASGAQEIGILGAFSVVPAMVRSEAYGDLGQYDKALEQAHIADRFLKENPSYDNHIKWVSDEIQSGLGLAYAFAGNKKDAKEIADTLASTFRFGPRREYTYTSAAKIYMAIGAYKEAAEVSQQKSFSSELFKSAISWNWSGIDLPLAFIKYKSLFETGRLDEAKVGYELILSNPLTKVFASTYWLILNDMGQIAARAGDNAAAIDYFKQTIDVIERQRSNINTESFKIGFVGDKQDVYRNMVSALITENRPGEAFEYAERAKARALIDMLASKEKLAAKGRDNVATIATLLGDEKREAAAVVAAIYSGTAKSGKLALDAPASVRDRLTTIDAETASLISVSVPGIKEIQNLLPAGETLIEYFGSGKELFAFVVDKQGVHAVKLDGERLHEDILEFRNWISPGGGETRGNRNLMRQQRVTTSAPASASALYGRLFQPLEPYIHNKNLTIVPHAALHYLPFAALNTGKNYLLDRYAIRMLPSASVMKYMRKNAASKKTTSALVLGNPDLGDPTYDLPYAEKEATAVGGMIKGSKVFLRKQATKAEVKKYGASAKYIHFASHGIFKPEQPLESGLALAKDGDGTGMLTVGELYEMRLDADLITLSACETALGKIERGDDVVGITRGFLYAGAGTIVSTLWQVDDEATGILMRTFYSQLKNNDKRSALRNAQLALKNGAKSQPYYWAAFQLTGAMSEEYQCNDKLYCPPQPVVQTPPKRRAKTR